MDARELRALQAPLKEHYKTSPENAVTPARATDGHFLHGVGAVNNAMGGAGVAAPVSILGTFYLNPAGLIAFDGLRVEFSFEMFKPDACHQI